MYEHFSFSAFTFLLRKRDLTNKFISLEITRIRTNVLTDAVGFTLEAMGCFVPVRTFDDDRPVDVDQGVNRTSLCRLRLTI